MKRCIESPRHDWREQCEYVGFDYHTFDGERYWDESASYQFSEAQIDCLDDCSNELYALCLDTLERILADERLAEMGIPEEFHAAVYEAWQQQAPSLYGRFDFSWDGQGNPKLLEFNADTPTSLLEASVVQWHWLEQRYPQHDQFNSIHERLIEGWRKQFEGKRVYFTCDGGSREDFGNTRYMMDTALQGGVKAQFIHIGDIGWADKDKIFVDEDDNTISQLFKLYPSEWMIKDEFGPHLLSQNMGLIEPLWKLVLSNKAILPMLWEYHTDHPNLLPASFDKSQLDSNNCVEKPFFSREGSNIHLVHQGQSLHSPGSYGAEGSIYQACHPLPEFSGNYPVIGAWIVHGEAAGIGIREDHSLITTDNSRFIPHYFC